MRFGIQVNGDGIFQQCMEAPVNAPLVLARMAAGREQAIADDSESRKARIALGKELSREGVYSFVISPVPPRGVMVHKFGFASRPGIEILGHSADDEELPASLFLFPGVGALLALGFYTGYLLWKSKEEIRIENKAVSVLMSQLRGGASAEVFRCTMKVSVDNGPDVDMLAVWQYTDRGAGIWFRRGTGDNVGGIVVPDEDIASIVGFLGLLYSVDNSYFGSG